MKDFIVIGLNNFGVEISKMLTTAGAAVTAIDRSREQVSRISPAVKHALLIEPGDLSPLQELKPACYDAVIVIVTEDLEFSLACLIELKHLNIKNTLICVGDEKQEKLVRLLGASNIFRIDEEIAKVLTSKLLK